MFDWFGGVPENIPEDWEPIPAEVWAELPPVPGDGLPLGVSAEWVDSCDRLVDRAIAAGPGAVALGWLTAVAPEVLSETARSHALAELTSITAHVSAVSHEYTAAIAGPAPIGQALLDERYPAQEVSVATRTSVYGAAAMISLARDLATVLKATGAAMRTGQITQPQARALHLATMTLPADLARAIEAKVLRFSHRQSLALFRASLRRWAARLDPDFTSRSKEARAAVEVSHTAHDDGTGQLFINGPLEITATINLALNAYAAQTTDELGGTVDQRKLAGLRDMAERYLADAHAPTQHGRTPTVNVTIDLATLLGLRQHPAEIPGLGPIPADAARWLLADGAPLRRLITDPLTGYLLDYGTTTYIVPPALADFLIAKNVTSAAPFSMVDARTTDMGTQRSARQGRRHQ